MFQMASLKLERGLEQTLITVVDHQREYLFGVADSADTTCLSKLVKELRLNIEKQFAV